jgi:ABC-type hemin transport system substrate-binding protein
MQSAEQSQPQTLQEVIEDYILTTKNLTDISEKCMDRSIEMINIWTGIKNQSRALTMKYEQLLEQMAKQTRATGQPQTTES